MDNLNHLILVGRLGQAPELKYFESGAVLAKVSLAVNRQSKDDRPDWFSLQIWSKQAEVVANYTTKGSLIGVEGELKLDEFIDRDGNPRSKPVIRVNRVELLSSNKSHSSTTEVNPEETDF